MRAGLTGVGYEHGPVHTAVVVVAAKAVEGSYAGNQELVDNRVRAWSAAVRMTR